MRLLDQITQSPAALLVRTPDGKETSLPAGGALAADLLRCPLRFVLSDEVTALAAEVAFEQRSMLPRALDILRLPAQSVWIEFNHRARHAQLQGAGLAPPYVTSQKVGLLARCTDDTMRRGKIRLAWEASGEEGPELCPIFAEFDFDRPYAGGAAIAALAFRPDLPQLNPVFERLRLGIDAAWEAYYASQCTGPRFDAALQQSALPLFVDVPMFFSVVLLTLAQGALSAREAHLGKLNRARQRNGRQMLLNHIELHMNLLGDPVRSGEASGGRKHGPRRHMVRGHFVRRRGSIHWRSPHLRGRIDRGEILTRNVAVRLG